MYCVFTNKQHKRDKVLLFSWQVFWPIFEYFQTTKRIFFRVKKDFLPNVWSCQLSQTFIKSTIFMFKVFQFLLFVVVSNALLLFFNECQMSTLFCLEIHFFKITCFQQICRIFAHYQRFPFQMVFYPFLMVHNLPPF